MAQASLAWPGPACSAAKLYWPYFPGRCAFFRVSCQGTLRERIQILCIHELSLLLSVFFGGLFLVVVVLITILFFHNLFKPVTFSHILLLSEHVGHTVPPWRCVLAKLPFQTRNVGRCECSRRSKLKAVTLKCCWFSRGFFFFFSKGIWH